MTSILKRVKDEYQRVCEVSKEKELMEAISKLNPEERQKFYSTVDKCFTVASHKRTSLPVENLSNKVLMALEKAGFFIEKDFSYNVTFVRWQGGKDDL